MHAPPTPLSPNPRSHPGFTLVELLVVVVIILVLAGLGFVGAAKSRNSANNVVALANMHQIGGAIASYQSERGRLPHFSGTGVSSALSTANTLTHASVLQSYLGLAEPTSTVQYAAVFKAPGLGKDNMAGKTKWYEVTAYAMYSTADIHKAKAYLPKGVVTDSAGMDVGPFGRTGTTGNPTSDGWQTGVLDRALAKYSTDNAGKIADLSMVPMMYEVNSKYPNIKGSWPWPVPQLPVSGDHINVVYFDWHAGSVDPDYFHNP